MILAEIILTDKKQIRKISLVKTPAVEVDFLKFAQERMLKMAVNTEKQNITGPVLIPNKRYYRNKDFFGGLEDGYIYFSNDTVRDIAIDFLKNASNTINIEHDDNLIVPQDNISIVESWIIDSEQDKAYSLGFSKDDLPVGTWMLTEHIYDDKLWEQIKSGDLRGYSIQGNPALKIISEGLAMDNHQDEEMSEELCGLILAHLKKVGQTKEQLEAEGWELDENIKMAIESDPNAESTLDNKRRLVRFYYKGPRDNKNRKFCGEVLDLNLWFRKEDINYMSFRSENKDFGTYSIFKYAGSYGCRHNWDKNYFSKSMKFQREEEIEEKILNAFDEAIKEIKNNK